jgi:hypothetical protein
MGLSGLSDGHVSSSSAADAAVSSSRAGLPCRLDVRFSRYRFQESQLGLEFKKPASTFAFNFNKPLSLAIKTHLQARLRHLLPALEAAQRGDGGVALLDGALQAQREPLHAATELHARGL